jgi:ribonuclease-3
VLGRSGDALPVESVLGEADRLRELQSTLGYLFSDLGLLLQALTHTSFGHEHLQVRPRSSRDNERLEFLGDAILGLVVSDLLLENFPNANEGQLSKMRAAIVNERSLSRLAQSIQLEKFIRLGKGELQTRGREKPSIISSTLEALIGAVYLDGGFGAARPVLMRLLAPIFSDPQSGIQWLNTHDFKTQLQELAQSKFRVTPIYELLQAQGPDHAKIFEVEVCLGTHRISRATGTSKKVAEQAAAQAALLALAGRNSLKDEPGSAGPTRDPQLRSKEI